MTQLISSVLVTGANGFIGKNLVMRLKELPEFEVSTFVRGNSRAYLQELISRADVVIHLAGENRPQDEAAFAQVNSGLTETLCQAVRDEATKAGRKVAVLLASSTQASLENPYGRSKLSAEKKVSALAEDLGSASVIFRLPGVFGKWCKPNYNSVVATFCHNIAHNVPIKINDPSTVLRLVYIDDVVNTMIEELRKLQNGLATREVQPEYKISLFDLASQIQSFEDTRTTLISERVGSGLTRALYATYISYLPTKRFSYEVTQHKDPRGVFVEFLKTQDSGQFSFFTAHPTITRGGHYHHSKSEKFLVIKGEALFRFRHLITDELVELRTTGAVPEVVDTIPGWSHEITNIGADEMLVMLWANENFDRDRPDTVSCRV